MNTHCGPWSELSEYEARIQTRNCSYNLLRITKEMPCVCVRGNFGSTNFHYCCSLLYICCCLLNIMRLAPDPVLIFVTLSWLRFLTLSRTSDAMQVSLLVCPSLLSGIYVSAGIQTLYLTTLRHWAGQNMWIKPQRLVCMTGMTSIMSTSLVLLLLLLFVRV